MTVRLLIYLGYYVLSLLVMRDYFSVLITLPMMALVIFNLRKIRDPFVTIADMIHFLMYLFFVVEPIQMIDHGRIGEHGPVSPVTYTNGQMAMAMVIATLFYAIFTLVTQLLERRRIRVEAVTIGRNWSIPLFAFVLATFIVYIWLSGGIGVVLSSRYERLLAQASQTSDVMAAIGSIIGGAFSMGVIIMATQVRKRPDMAFWCFVAAMGLVAIRYNPFNAARFALLEVYVPLGLVLMRGRVRAATFYGVAMFGIVVLFPILNISTRYGLEYFSEKKGSILTDALSLQFVDTFDILVECVRYVGINGYDHGAKTLATLVAYYPRVWWPAKPMLGGLDVGNGLLQQGVFGTANVSQIVAADGYMDFGLTGVALTGVVVGLWINFFVYKRRVLVNGHDLFGYAFIAALPILTRGPLGAVVTFFLFQILCLLAIRRVLGRRVRVPGDVQLQGLGVVRTGSSSAPDLRERMPSPPRGRPRPALPGPASSG